jgi:hypothetical protein
MMNRIAPIHRNSEQLINDKVTFLLGTRAEAQLRTRAEAQLRTGAEAQLRTGAEAQLRTRMLRLSLSYNLDLPLSISN